MLPDSLGANSCIRCWQNARSVNRILVVVITGDRGLAARINTNIVRYAACNGLTSILFPVRLRGRRAQGPRPAAAPPQNSDGRFQQSARRALALRMFLRLAGWRWMNS